MGMLELQAIYNRHMTSEDALRSAELIPADSIVYVEGLQLEPLPIDNLAFLAETLGTYQRRFGKDSEYEVGKDILIDEFKADIMQAGPDDYGAAYEDSLYIELLKKDCQIIPADYKHETDPARQKKNDAITKKISRWYDQEKKTGTGKGINKDSAQYFVALEALIRRRRWAMDVRERSTVEVIGRDITELLDTRAENKPSLRRSDEDRVRAYLTYGAMHAYSLTRKLTDAGAVVVPHILTPLDRSMYLEETHDESTANRLRSLGLTAFMAATWTVAEHSDIEDIEATSMYDKLGALNTDRELAFDFSTRCLKIQKLSAKKPKKALAYYMRLIEDYS